MGMAAKNLLLAGGGHSHALVLRMWAMHRARRPQALITLVSRCSTALYSGMVPGLVAGLYSREQAAIDLRQLCQLAGVSFVQAEITGLDLPGSQLLLGERAALGFDWLSLDVGAEIAEEGAIEPGTQQTETTISVKPLEPFLAWCEKAVAGQVAQPKPHPRLLGSGAAAVELALALRARGLQPALQTKPSGLALGSAAANRGLGRVLDAAGISHGPPDPGPDGATIACTGSRGPRWLAASGLPTDARGRVRTDSRLVVEGHPRLLASGDCGVLSSDPRPASGVWAVRAAPVLAANLQAAMAGRPLRRWRPQRRALQLLGDGGVSGPPRAIGLWGPWALGPSRWLWQWKDRIDRRFMERFKGLQTLMGRRQGAESAAMACRGCAAKLAAEPLRAALQTLGPLRNDDAAVIGRDGSGQWLLQSVDGFPALLSDPWLNARLTTLHACSDLWACGGAVTSAQAVVTLPQLAPGLQSELLRQTLAGVRSVLDPLGAQLLGGHTLEARDALPGAGLSLMLTVNGSAPAERLWPKGPLHQGDVLILTRPVGSGVLFAAAMAAAAKPHWIDQALAVLQQSQALLVELLAAHDCRACTDITGFGLLGHLGEMLAASPAGTRLQLDATALAGLALPGALELLAAGHASTLAPANAQALALLESPVSLQGDASAPLQQLLIDPQTCGPLLAAVPAERAAAAIAALQQQGFQQAAVIGQVMA